MPSRLAVFVWLIVIVTHLMHVDILPMAVFKLGFIVFHVHAVVLLVLRIVFVVILRHHVLELLLLTAYHRCVLFRRNTLFRRSVQKAFTWAL